MDDYFRETLLITLNPNWFIVYAFKLDGLQGFNLVVSLLKHNFHRVRFSLFFHSPSIIASNPSIHRFMGIQHEEMKLCSLSE